MNKIYRYRKIKTTDLNNTIDKIDLAELCTQQLINMHTSSAQTAISKINHMLGHKSQS